MQETMFSMAKAGGCFPVHFCRFGATATPYEGTRAGTDSRLSWRNLSCLLTMCALLGAGMPARAQTALGFDAIDDLMFIGATPSDLIIICPSNITVACFGDVPEPDFGSVQLSTDCSEATITYGGDFAVTNASGATIFRYYGAADSCGHASFCTQTITVRGLPPRVLFFTTGGDEVEGGIRIDFHVFVDGTPPFGFVWFFPDGIINTTTSTVSRIFGPFNEIPGTVPFVVTNSCGMDSGEFRFSLGPPLIALRRGFPESRTGTRGSGSGLPCPAYLTSCGSFGAAAHWFNMGTEDGGTATISTEGSDYDTFLGVYTGSILDPCHLNMVACNNDISATNKQSRVQFHAIPYAPYWLVVAGSNAGTLKLTYGLEPSIDVFTILPDGSFELQSLNVPAFSYRVLGSTDLQTWQTLFSTNLLKGGDLYFVDPIAPGFRQRFYRFESGP